MKTLVPFEKATRRDLLRILTTVETQLQMVVWSGTDAQLTSVRFDFVRLQKASMRSVRKVVAQTCLYFLHWEKDEPFVDCDFVTAILHMKGKRAVALFDQGMLEGLRTLNAERCWINTSIFVYEVSCDL